jgi:hypothetical protein
MAYVNHGDGDRHGEQKDGDRDPQKEPWAIPSHTCLMPFLLHSTFICDDVFVYISAVVK